MRSRRRFLGLIPATAAASFSACSEESIPTTSGVKDGLAVWNVDYRLVNAGGG
jgi:hypothetical protein